MINSGIFGLLALAGSMAYNRSLEMDELREENEHLRRRLRRHKDDDEWDNEDDWDEDLDYDWDEGDDDYYDDLEDDDDY